MYKENQEKQKQNILKVCEKNCYSEKQNECQHVCIVMENGEPVSKIFNSWYIYNNLKEQAPMHIKSMYENAVV